MEGKRRVLVQGYDIKKGPWKVEEDQVLMNHVKKHGPRDWSSIRSKGLLRRTGKSCRLRWVNKLRPDLKTGVKFSGEEERTVIDLQAQFGNKWAKIATYLPGRTDNDVKNFWSSRQKRLARILHTSPKPHKQIQTTPPPIHQATPSLMVMNNNQLNFTSSSQAAKEEEASASASASAIETVNDDHIVFPQFQPDYYDYYDYPLAMERQDLIGGPSFVDDEFGSALGTAQLPILPSERDIGSMIDDVPPIDLFDQIDQLPSPSHWSSTC